jgi:hypothetical protein
LVISFVEAAWMHSVIAAAARQVCQSRSACRGRRTAEFPHKPRNPHRVESARVVARPLLVRDIRFIAIWLVTERFSKTACVHLHLGFPSLPIPARCEIVVRNL